jgi:RNA polymerase subunit RPABC4/transcription elongation factor Spt4
MIQFILLSVCDKCNVVTADKTLVCPNCRGPVTLCKFVRQAVVEEVVLEKQEGAG